MSAEVLFYLFVKAYNYMDAYIYVSQSLVNRCLIAKYITYYVVNCFNIQHSTKHFVMLLNRSIYCNNCIQDQLIRLTYQNYFFIFFNFHSTYYSKLHPVHKIKTKYNRFTNSQLMHQYTKQCTNPFKAFHFDIQFHNKVQIIVFNFLYCVLCTSVCLLDLHVLRSIRDDSRFRQVILLCLYLNMLYFVYCCLSVDCLCFCHSIIIMFSDNSFVFFNSVLKYTIEWCLYKDAVGIIVADRDITKSGADI